jgi:hypothetical protein
VSAMQATPLCVRYAGHPSVCPLYRPPLYASTIQAAPLCVRYTGQPSVCSLCRPPLCVSAMQATPLCVHYTGHLSVCPLYRPRLSVSSIQDTQSPCVCPLCRPPLCVSTMQATSVCVHNAGHPCKCVHYADHPCLCRLCLPPCVKFPHKLQTKRAESAPRRLAVIHKHKISHHTPEASCAHACIGVVIEINIVAGRGSTPSHPPLYCCLLWEDYVWV